MEVIMADTKARKFFIKKDEYVKVVLNPRK